MILQVELIFRARLSDIPGPGLHHFPEGAMGWSYSERRLCGPVLEAARVVREIEFCRELRLLTEGVNAEFLLVAVEKNLLMVSLKTFSAEDCGLCRLVAPA